MLFICYGSRAKTAAGWARWSRNSTSRRKTSIGSKEDLEHMFELSMTQPKHTDASKCRGSFRSKLMRQVVAGTRIATGKEKLVFRT